MEPKTFIPLVEKYRQTSFNDIVTILKKIFIKSEIKQEKRKHKIFLSDKIISNDWFSSSAYFFYNLL